MSQCEIAENQAEQNKPHAVAGIEAHPTPPHGCFLRDDWCNLAHADLQRGVTGYEIWPPERIDEVDDSERKDDARTKNHENSGGQDDPLFGWVQRQGAFKIDTSTASLDPLKPLQYQRSPRRRKAALALNPRPTLVFASAANTEMLPQPKPRAVREHFVVPSISSRDVACAQRSNVRRFEHFLYLLNIVNDAFNVHSVQYPTRAWQSSNGSGIRMSCLREPSSTQRESASPNVFCRQTHLN